MLDIDILKQAQKQRKKKERALGEALVAAMVIQGVDIRKIATGERIMGIAASTSRDLSTVSSTEALDRLGAEAIRQITEAGEGKPRARAAAAAPAPAPDQATAPTPKESVNSLFRPGPNTSPASEPGRTAP